MNATGLLATLTIDTTGFSSGTFDLRLNNTFAGATTFIDAEVPVIKAAKLFHPLLPTPVSYDVTLNQQENFLFLTGANMGGKSTFIKAVGVAVYLAHTGMGVPAQEMQLTLFDGLLSNINVVDNIVQGESYFFNEVQRIRKTIDKISDGKKWLILIDELFKGTNVQDAMKCSSTVIEGLLKIKNSLRLGININTGVEYLITNRIGIDFGVRLSHNNIISFGARLSYS